MVEGGTLRKHHEEKGVWKSWNKDSPTIQGALRLKRVAASCEMKTQPQKEQVEFHGDPQGNGSENQSPMGLIS